MYSSSSYSYISMNHPPSLLFLNLINAVKNPWNIFWEILGVYVITL